MSREPRLLALDVGTSSVKAALFDGRGRPQAVHVEEYTLEKPAPDRVELDAEVYWNAARTALAGVLRQSATNPRDILSVGVTSQGETLIALGADGVPLRKAIVWLDNRAVREAGEIAAAFDLEDVYRITGQQEIVPCWPAIISSTG